MVGVLVVNVTLHLANLYNNCTENEKNSSLFVLKIIFIQSNKVTPNNVSCGQGLNYTLTILLQLLR